MKRSLRIAVAEDESDLRLYFQKLLPRLGHQVVAVAENGRDLVEQCRTVAPDLVITDVAMPEMDGLAAVQAIWRERPVPVILLSAHFDAAQLPSAETGPLLVYLAKPVSQADLQLALELVLRCREKHSANGSPLSPLIAEVG